MGAGYESLSSKLVQALREAIEMDLSEASEREARPPSLKARTQILTLEELLPKLWVPRCVQSLNDRDGPGG